VSAVAVVCLNVAVEILGATVSHLGFQVPSCDVVVAHGANTCHSVVVESVGEVAPLLRMQRNMNADVFDRMSREVGLALYWARSLVSTHGGLVVAPEHLLLAIVQKDWKSVASLVSPGWTQPRFEACLTDNFEASPRIGTDVEIPFDQRVHPLLERAKMLAGEQQIQIEHLLVALVDDSGNAGRCMRRAGITRARIEWQLKKGP